MWNNNLEGNSGDIVLCIYYFLVKYRNNQICVFLLKSEIQTVVKTFFTLFPIKWTEKEQEKQKISNLKSFLMKTINLSLYDICFTY